jgi:hypothetical protein
VQITSIIDFDPTKRGAFQGDLAIFKLTDEEASKLSGRPIKRSETGDMRLLEGEVSGHHHTIMSKTWGLNQPVSFRDDALARASEAETLHGSAVLYEDPELLSTLPWLRRRDLAIGLLKIEGGPVVLGHPEHDAIRLPVGTFYVGRQIESAGAEERVVAD